jgi:hypothetical protein
VPWREARLLRPAPLQTEPRHTPQIRSAPRPRAHAPHTVRSRHAQPLHPCLDPRLAPLRAQVDAGTLSRTAGRGGGSRAGGKGGPGGAAAAAEPTSTGAAEPLAPGGTQFLEMASRYLHPFNLELGMARQNLLAIQVGAWCTVCTRLTSLLLFSVVYCFGRTSVVLVWCHPRGGLGLAACAAEQPSSSLAWARAAARDAPRRTHERPARA